METNQCRICRWMCALGPCTIYKMQCEKKINFLSPSLFLSLFLSARLQQILKPKQLFRREPGTRLRSEFPQKACGKGVKGLWEQTASIFFKPRSIQSPGSGDTWGQVLTWCASGTVSEEKVVWLTGPSSV